MFPVVHDANISTREENDDVRIISNSAFQWKICFNVDVNKQAEEAVFSWKIKSNIHPLLVFSNTIASLKLTLKNI